MENPSVDPLEVAAADVISAQTREKPTSTGPSEPAKPTSDAPKPAEEAPKPSWWGEPLSNFVLQDGKPVMKDGGEPQRKSKRPRKYSDGDITIGSVLEKLGGREPTQRVSVSRLVRPGQGGGKPGEDDAASTSGKDGGGVELGIDAGDFIADQIEGAAEAAFGEPGKATPTESRNLHRTSREAFGSHLVHPLVAFVAALVLFGVGIWKRKAAQRQENGKDAKAPRDTSSADHRPDAERQDSAGQGAGFTYPPS